MCKKTSDHAVHVTQRQHLLGVQLLAESVRLAIDDMRHQFLVRTELDQTFHFYQEGKKAYERGRLLAVEAGRLTMRTLRGWLKSVPIISDNNPYFIPLEDSVANVATVRGIGIYYEFPSLWDVTDLLQERLFAIVRSYLCISLNGAIDDDTSNTQQRREGTLAKYIRPGEATNWRA